ncbi:MAG: alpha-glucan family phosphorylase [Anaerolineae bacterium]
MPRPNRVFTVIPLLPEQLAPMREIAMNLWWSWNLDAVDLFRRLDRDLWETAGHNPILILGTVSQDRLEEAAVDEGFLAHMRRVHQALKQYMETSETWYKRTYANTFPNHLVAYFSAEFGINECLPIYSGGLGVLAGDHLKSASDLDVPLVGVSLLYQEGYFRQYLNADGWQQESYPLNDFANLPMELQRSQDGQPIVVVIDYPGRQVTAQVWKVQVGRVSLYLLDTNIISNRPEDRMITSRLYGGDLDMRIRQEIMLGIGGFRALKLLGINPSICHMNEGHSAFLALERIRMAMQDNGLSFDEARQATQAGNIFTTHTNVPAGIDLFPPSMIDYYFGAYREQIGLNRDELLSLGQNLNNPNDGNFSMAVLALRLAAHANGVSELHGQVAREMWQSLWPQLPIDEVPITSITNGIHVRSYISDDMTSLLLRYLGPRWVERPYDHTVWSQVERIPDEELWRTHERRRERLVAVARARLRRQLERRGATATEIDQAGEVLHPDVCTITFARRFATYKRATLLFADPDRLARILNDPQRPVQIIFAGKAHPHDNPGKEFIRQIVRLTRREDLHQRIVFLEDYDINLARYLVQGSDVWLNTPRHRMEASGTSGMKAAANGVVNVSTLDGWWCEGFTPETGWAIGRGEVYADDQYGDKVEAEALYSILEQEVIPLFYKRNGQNLPHGWVAKMKSTMHLVTPKFNTHRMVQEYAERFYLPSERRYDGFIANEYANAREFNQWLKTVQQHWQELHIDSVEGDDHEGITVGSTIHVKARIRTGALTPKDILVQAYYGSVDTSGQINRQGTVALEAGAQQSDGTWLYEGDICCVQSGLQGYTLRVQPAHHLLGSAPLPGLIVWSS